MLAIEQIGLTSGRGQKNEAVAAFGNTGREMDHHPMPTGLSPRESRPIGKLYDLDHQLLPFFFKLALPFVRDRLRNRLSFLHRSLQQKFFL